MRYNNRIKTYELKNTNNVKINVNNKTKLNVMNGIQNQVLSDNHTIGYFEEKNKEFLYDKNLNSGEKMIEINNTRYLANVDTIDGEIVRC